MATQPPGPKLDDAQREQLLTWLAAGYGSPLIAVWFQEREWPELSRAALTYYRKKYCIKIAALQAARHDTALNTGLAIKAERVARLQEDADKLDALKWIPGRSGKLYNEAAWRETLRQIAEELGQWVQKWAPTTPDGTDAWTPLDLSSLSEEELEAYERLLRKAQRRA